jgi:hypothetical protein
VLTSAGDAAKEEKAKCLRLGVEHMRASTAKERGVAGLATGIDVHATMWSGWRRLMTDHMSMTWMRSMQRIGESVAAVFEREKTAGLSTGDDPVPTCSDEDITCDRPLLTAQRDRKYHPPARKVGSRRLKMARGITVDSGAADNVMPRSTLRRWMKVRQSEASRAGVHYVAANGARIANEGEADFAFQDKDGKRHSWVFQVADVNKVLASVSAMVDAGHRVVFDRDEVTGTDLSFITCKATGESIKMRRDRNVWTIDAFVDEDSDFSRQE